MKRTTLSLPDDLAQVLDREARRQHTSVSEIARKALRKHLGLELDGPRELPFVALGRSGRSSTARDMERLLASEWDDGPRRT